MRGTEYLFLVVIIGVFSWITIQGAVELNSNFPENQINTSGFSEDYEDIEKIQDISNQTLENFLILGKEDTAWYQKLGAGIVAIPYAVIAFPRMLAIAVTSLSSMVTTSLGGILPSVILLAIITFLLVYIVRELLSFFQRSRS
jgi:hypothetical protein